MDSELLTRGVLYLSLAVAGIPGNIAVICGFLMALHQDRRLLTADSIVLHLALANLLVVAVRCVLEVFATFEIVNVFDDTGCKAVIFVYRTARSLSIWLTFVLSAYQSLSIAPPGSHWATARDLFSQFLWLIFLVVWMINISISSPSIIFATGAKNTSKLLQNSINVQFCFVNFPSVIVKDANGAVQTVRDVVPMALMTTASLIILLFLYRHSRQVRAIRGSGGGGAGPGGGGSSERRAAITVVTLVTLYVVLYGVDNGLWVYTIMVKQTMSSALISDLRIFFSSLYAAMSPVVIIVSNKKVNKHLRCGSEEKMTMAAKG
ncbi:olfactory receptor class A-like protein 1 [Tachysurus vachellii]|uniref:olfactory receptor class A-like protein 1 n=1 Tax=Tachysurus vachellii TaxID=175792 RepID=UPI00296B4BB8|nr:olfactory receptor class A-like protein 1 [Tachysurus vachellii]